MVSYSRPDEFWGKSETNMENNYSAKWKKRGTRQGLLRNALLKTMGYTDEDIEKPLIGIVNTWSETNPGHYNFR